LNPLFLFRSYRELWEHNLLLKGRVAELERNIYDLMEIRKETTSAPQVETLLQEFRKNVLEEQPFDNNKIPEHMYLSPPYPEEK